MRWSVSNTVQQKRRGLFLRTALLRPQQRLPRPSHLRGGGCEEPEIPDQLSPRGRGYDYGESDPVYLSAIFDCGIERPGPYLRIGGRSISARAVANPPASVCRSGDEDWDRGVVFGHLASERMRPSDASAAKGRGWCFCRRPHSSSAQAKIAWPTTCSVCGGVASPANAAA